MGRKTHGIVFVSKSREGREQLASRINRLRPLKQALRLLLYSISRDAEFSKFERAEKSRGVPRLCELKGLPSQGCFQTPTTQNLTVMGVCVFLKNAAR